VANRRGASGIRIASLFLVLVALIAATTSSASAQDGDIVVGDGEANVTVIYEANIVANSPGDGSREPWPYTCRWFALIGGSEIEAFRTANPTAGTRYRLVCTPRDGFDVPPISEIVIYNPVEPIPGGPFISSLQVRDVARDFLRPDPLLVGVSPDFVQITGVETWLWPDGSIDRVAATAAAGGLVVTVQARWQGTTFDVGEDGVSPIRCGEQRAWTERAVNPDCSHTYLTEATLRTITASSDWDVVWWDNAAQPAPVFLETITAAEALDVEVIDLEAVISRSR
jgi:hypothetical protein